MAKTTEKVPCPICRKPFHPMGLAPHISLGHKNDVVTDPKNDRTCRKCGKEFETIEGYQIHLGGRGCKGIRRDSITLKSVVPNRRFFGKGKVTLFEGKKGNFQCPFCSFVCAGGAGLASHCKSEHPVQYEKYHRAKNRKNLPYTISSNIPKTPSRHPISEQRGSLQKNIFGYDLSKMTLEELRDFKSQITTLLDAIRSEAEIKLREFMTDM